MQALELRSIIENMKAARFHRWVAFANIGITVLLVIATAINGLAALKAH
jgi:hypothetical protein